MMEIRDNDSDEIISGINVTPLVDITLVLLIIFMVTASYIVSSSIKISLPKASKSEKVVHKNITIVLTKGHALYLNGKKTTLPAIKAFCAEQLNKDKDLTAIIGADREVPHGSVVSLIDLIKRIGITKFAINIDRAEESTMDVDMDKTFKKEQPEPD